MNSWFFSLPQNTLEAVYCCIWVEQTNDSWLMSMKSLNGFASYK